jgi:hypothetical protein
MALPENFPSFPDASEGDTVLFEDIYYIYLNGVWELDTE